MIDLVDIMTLYQPKHCRECGTQVSDHSRTLLCRKCDSRLRARARTLKRRAEGVCVLCGSPVEDGFKRCAACREKRRKPR